MTARGTSCWGELVRMTPAGGRHGGCCARVARLLIDYAEQQGGAQVATNDRGLFLQRDPDAVLASDVVYWSCGGGLRSCPRAMSRWHLSTWYFVRLLPYYNDWDILVDPARNNDREE
ncbi:MAG TPA: hypothetical protein EYP56_06160, partial [Planctomycetaceae bacterium]|nr:hypothetical protein [Planctomycetaceae bacterium]